MYDHLSMPCVRSPGFNIVPDFFHRRGRFIKLLQTCIHDIRNRTSPPSPQPVYLSCAQAHQYGVTGNRSGSYTADSGGTPSPDLLQSLQRLFPPSRHRPPPSAAISEGFPPMIRSCPAVYFPLLPDGQIFCRLSDTTTGFIADHPGIFHNSAVVVAAALRSGSVNAIGPVSLLCLPGGGSKRGQYGNPATCRHTATDINRPSSRHSGHFQPVHLPYLTATPLMIQRHP
ncbi:Uncharacterised protein [Escherichia coli]|nr:Uncharacterised protein [Escherichia coli]